ncbi:hypothetical protein ACP4OV_020091 [Aristida adscensionis]
MPARGSAPAAAPSRRAGAPLHQLPKTSSRSEPRGHFLRKVCTDDSCLHLRSSALSKTGWASKERSTPEGYNREKHSWRFESPFPQGMSPASLVMAYQAAFPAEVVVCPPKKKKSPEERNAIREKRIAQRERDSLRRIQTALRKYNNANNTKPENHHSAGGSTTLFFAEINCPLRSEDDVLLCSIVGEKDAGHCHACKKYYPMMVHPSSRAYGGGNTTAIDYPDEDSSSSDSDY